MFPYSKVGEELKLQKLWEFRRRDDEDLDSDDDSKASSEPVVKKHKLVSNLISHDKGNIDGRFQHEKQEEQSFVNDDRTKFKKFKRVISRNNTRKDGLAAKSELRMDFHEENNRRKRRKSSYGTENAAMDDLKTFMGSLLKELEVSRENLFEYMRKEMQNMEGDNVRNKVQKQNPQVENENNYESNEGKNRHIVWETLDMHQRINFKNNIEEQRNRTRTNSKLQEKNISKFGTRTQNYEDPSPEKLTESLEQNNRSQQPQKSIVLGIRAQTCNGEALRRSGNGKRIENNDRHIVHEDRFDYYSQAGGRSISLSKSLPIDAKFSVHSSSQLLPSSMYLSLPTVLTETGIINQKLDPLYIQPSSAANKACTNLDSTSHCGRFPISKVEERFGQMSSVNLNCFDGNRFPVPLLYGGNGGFNNSSHGCSEKSLQEEISSSNNPLNTSRMNRGVVRLSGGNYGLSQHYDVDKLHKDSSYKPDSRHLVYQIPNINNGHLFQK